MHEKDALRLEESSEFYRAVRKSPPLAVHAVVVLLASTLVAALLWSAVTEASLVVRANGRIRPEVS